MLICEECHDLEAIERVRWFSYLPSHANVADLGCGGGWLTGYLSKLETVDSISALDSSARYLTTMLAQCRAV